MLQHLSLNGLYIGKPTAEKKRSYENARRVCAALLAYAACMSTPADPAHTGASLRLCRHLTQPHRHRAALISAV